MKPHTNINNPKTIDNNFIKSELDSGRNVTVCFSEICYDDNILLELNELCKVYTSEFGIRFYGHYYEIFDFNILKKIPNVKWLETDCLSETKNIQVLTDLNHLEKLALGAFDLKEKEILSSEKFFNLKELIIGETKTKTLNLKYLEKYKSLTYLILSEHTKNIDSLRHLSNLEFLKLYSIKKAPLNFINELRKLKTLKIVLGSRENILEIGENKIENLEITFVRGFNDISNISNFQGLKSLRIADNIQLEEVDFNYESPFLEELYITNCKKLSILRGIDKLTSLKTLVLVGTNLNFDAILNQELPNSLNYFGFYTNKSKEDARYAEIIKSRGYETSIN